MSHNYWAVFAELIAKPFEQIEMVWGIVPLYFALLLNEMTSARATHLTAVQTGFSFVWAAAQWLYPYCVGHADGARALAVGPLLTINVLVTFLVLGIGLVALVSGLRRKFPKYGSFLGHTRFANYFMIAIYPIQAHALAWTWERLIAIVVFAVPVWASLHFALMPVRNRR